MLLMSTRIVFVTQLLDNGAPLEFIQGMLGHEKHPQHRFMLSFMENDEENCTGGIFRRLYLSPAQLLGHHKS